MFQNKRILVGISASIAAYKSVFLVRLLKKHGAEVKVVLTPSAHDFVTPLSLATLSDNPVYSEFTESKEAGTWTNHVELGLWADLMIIAPATANTLSKMVQGEADNFLLACYLSAKCPVMFAPAMDRDMFIHPSTQKNIKKLQEYGNVLIPSEDGFLASGLHGHGRMAEPETIIEKLRAQLYPDSPLKGKRVLITAGPTFEAIDPVRFIGNRSTGRMGYALAKEAFKLGCEVTLISGPSHETTGEGINLIKIESAQDMYEACLANFDSCDVLIMSAAVADYTPANYSDIKIKKKEGDLHIELKRTQDILAALSERKKDQVMLGFALETNNELENAKSKLERKQLDMIVLNSLKDKGAGFGGQSNKVTILDKHNNILNFELKSKSEVAKDILTQINKYYEAR